MQLAFAQSPACASLFANIFSDELNPMSYVYGNLKTIKETPTFKNFSIAAIHYLTAMTCGVV